MTSTSDARWSGVLLAAGACAAVGSVLPWARGLGATVPDSADLTDSELAAPGTVGPISAQGVGGIVGAVLLALACVLVVTALWRASPAYRPVSAGYLTIVVGAVAVAATLWFVGDEELRYASFGPGVDVQTDSVTLTPWPWITMGCFGIAVVTGVLVVPRRTPERETSDRSSSGRAH